jgi:hypothetical protein
MPQDEFVELHIDDNGDVVDSDGNVRDDMPEALRDCIVDELLMPAPIIVDGEGRPVRPTGIA